MNPIEIALSCIVIFVIGFMAGASIMIESNRMDAVRRGYAEWAKDERGSYLKWKEIQK